MWLSYATATTIGYGDVTSKTLLGRIAILPISLIGFIVIGSISGLVSSLMTIDQMEAHLQSLGDLSGRTVAYQSETAGAALGAAAVQNSSLPVARSQQRSGSL